MQIASSEPSNAATIETFVYYLHSPKFVKIYISQSQNLIRCPSMKFQILLASLFSQMKTRQWWLTILFWIALSLPAQASVIIRVAIERDVNQVKVGSSTAAAIKDGSGRTLGQLPAMGSYFAQAIPGGGVALDKWRSGLFWIEPTGRGHVYINDRWYRGRTLVLTTEKGITAVKLG